VIVIKISALLVGRAIARATSKPTLVNLPNKILASQRQRSSVGAKETHMNFIRITCLAAILVFSGCAKHVTHPGTANAFDSDAYDTLLVTRSVIETSKTDLAAGSFPASISANVKTALNTLITAYNALETAYCGTPITNTQGTLQCDSASYHANAMTGTATPAQTAQITALCNQVSSATTALSAAKGGR
jgi:hypothetical protein